MREVVVVRKPLNISFKRSHTQQLVVGYGFDEREKKK